MLFLVRHAKAGDRCANRADDFVRPLSKKGWAQAEDLVAPLLAAQAGAALFASPYVRCMQTLAPLANHFQVAVIADERLEEGSSIATVIDMLASVPEGSVMCSHGDVIPEVISALQRRGCEITTRPNWTKGSVWMLKRDATGTITQARSWPAPAERS